MNRTFSTGWFAALLVAASTFVLPAWALQPPGGGRSGPPRPGEAHRDDGRRGEGRRDDGRRDEGRRRGEPSLRSAQQWVRQLESELDRLEEDLFFRRGAYPEGLGEQVDRTARAAAHFRQLLRREAPYRELIDNYRDMDRHVHRLVERLEGSGDPWLQRQAARIRYPDEQLHFVLRMGAPDRDAHTDELLKRHARVLEQEARNLHGLLVRAPRDNSRLVDAAEEFADATQRFERAVQRGAERRQLVDAFRDLDKEWRGVVEQINRSPHGLFVRRSAQNVNRVHNQLHQLLAVGHAPPPRITPGQPVPPPRVAPPQRPAIEFEIPGIGRFSIPR